MINSQEIIDDEIDIMPFIIALLKNYKLFILGSIIAIFCAIGLTEGLTKKYRASASFIIPNTISASSASGLLAINNIFNKI